MKPTISVIIPANNEEKYIDRTLESIRKQIKDDGDDEIIVVVNGCTDKTEEIVTKAKIKNLRILSLSLANVSRARNYGAGKARNEILLFLDADTSLETGALEKIKGKFTSDLSVATTRVYPDSQELRYSLAMTFKNIYNLTGIYQGCSGVLICRKEHFDQVNGYDPKIIVKEHRLLIQKLLQNGRYACLDVQAITSMRRLKKWGLGKSALFWVSQWFKSKLSSLEKSEYEKVR